MKNLIIFYGRTGSTMLYSSLLHHYSMSRGDVSEMHNDNFMNAVSYTKSNSDWTMKMHIDTGITMDRHSTLLEYFIDSEQVDNIYFSYRQDIFDTYLSNVIARHSEVWNSETKHEYKPIDTEKSYDILTQCGGDMNDTFNRWYFNQIRLHQKYNILPISYEQLNTTGKVSKVIPVHTTIVKQNSLEDKLSLFDNEAVVRECFWKLLKQWSWDDNGRLRYD